MRNCILIILLALSTFSFAQNRQEDGASKRKEFHIRIQDFTPFKIGLDYKHQVKPKGYVTISLINVGFNKSKDKVKDTNTELSEQTNISGGIKIGYEFRKEFKEKFTFYHGPNIGYSYTYQKRIVNNSIDLVREYKDQNHSLLVPYNIGLMYQFHKNILISAQVSPQFTFTHSKMNDYVETNRNTYNFSFSNLAGTLALVFRFNE